MLCAAFGRETQDCHFRVLDSSNGFGGFASLNGNLCQFLRCGHGKHGAVGKHHNAVVAIGLVFQNHHKRARNARNTRFCLNYLKSRTKHIASSVVGTSNLAFGHTHLHHHRAQVERILEQTGGLFGRHSLVLAQFNQFVDKLLLARVVLRVNNLRFRDILQPEIGSFLLQFGLVANQNNVGNALFDNCVGGLNGALLVAFGQNNCLLLPLGVLFDLL